MKRKMLYVAGGLAALVVILVIAAYLLIDANKFRPTVEAQLSDALGRKVQIADLRLSLFSGGISARDISIADDPALSDQRIHPFQDPGNHILAGLGARCERHCEWRGQRADDSIQTAAAIRPAKYKRYAGRAAGKKEMSKYRVVRQKGRQDDPTRR